MPSLTTTSPAVSPVFAALAAYEATNRTRTPQDLNDLSYALNCLFTASLDEVTSTALLGAVEAVCRAWTALEDATDHAGRAAACRMVEEATAQACAAILQVCPHAHRMHGTDMPATADTIRAAARDYNVVDGTDEELAATFTGTPLVRVNCRSDSGTGWNITATITAGVDTPLGFITAHPPLVVKFRRPDGREDAAETIRRVIGARFHIDVPIQYATDHRP
ncbi:hypothetical protein [Streptomyces sp. NPDC056304]|uniref:hypothetical protein n=1 Tax=Streptomyces sp. NPDC056304 TaxID=3345778 RepID=UPI0035DA8D20